MNTTVDLQLILQMILAAMILLTLHDTATSSNPNTLGHRKESDFITLEDGINYVNHAGMTIELELYSTFQSQIHAEPANNK